MKAKLKVANRKERPKKWKEHFKNLFGNPNKITDEPTTSNLNTLWMKNWMQF